MEEVFGWMKTVALQRKTRFRGLERVGWMFTFAAAACNLVRMRNLKTANAQEKCARRSENTLRNIPANFHPCR